MPGSLKTEAIVLRSMRYGEADRILHVFTPDRGRLSAIAKGVRRAKTRFGGRLEPYFRLQLVLYQGRSDLFTVTHAETVAGYPRLREHGGALDSAARACDAVSRLFDDHDAHRGVFNLLANQLALLDAQPEPRGTPTRSPSGSSCCSPPASRPSSPPARTAESRTTSSASPARRAASSARRARRTRSRWPGRARLPRRRARPAAGRDARRAAACAGPGRARDPGHARAPRERPAAPGRVIPGRNVRRKVFRLRRTRRDRPRRASEWEA